MLTSVRNAICSLWRPVAVVSNSRAAIWMPLIEITKRHYSDAEAGSDRPHKPRRGVRRFYEYKLFTGGVLPRPGGEWDDKPLPMPKVDHTKRDNWTKKKALFGQNDYIDILGDGSIHPWELIVAPAWLKGYRGNELQRISRQLAINGTFLRETFPTKYHSLVKQLFYCFKKLNRRRHAPYWGGYRRYSRIDKPVM